MRTMAMFVSWLEFLPWRQAGSSISAHTASVPGAKPSSTGDLLSKCEDQTEGDYHKG